MITKRYIKFIGIEFSLKYFFSKAIIIKCEDKDFLVKEIIIYQGLGG